MVRPKPLSTPPPRDGVGASRVASGARYPSVAHFLEARFPRVTDWPERFLRGDVLDAQCRPADPRAPCLPGTALWYWRKPPPEPRVPFEVELLHQDARLVVIDKPHFLPVTPGGRHLHETVLVRLKKMLGIDTLAPMHRLDLETAGVLAFTVQPQTRHAYQALFRDRQVTKVYEAVAPWHEDLALPLVCRHRLETQEGEGFMQMRVLPGEPNAETRIALIDRIGDGLALYRLTPVTGRKHQLRAQMNALGLPIVGDRIYPDLLPEMPPDYARPLQLLARALQFADPVDGSVRRFESRRVLALSAGAQAGRMP